MRKLVMMSAVLLAGCSLGADLPVARGGVDTLHKQLNAGQCADIRTQAADDFRSTGTAESWQQMCDLLAKGLGKFVSLKETGWNDETGTNGHIIRITYESTFEKGKATEQFMFRIVGNKPSLVGYHVNSDVFNMVPVLATPAPTPTSAATPKPK